MTNLSSYRSEHNIFLFRHSVHKMYPKVASRKDKFSEPEEQFFSMRQISSYVSECKAKLKNIGSKTRN